MTGVMKNTAIVIAYFFVLILASGIAMILASQWVRASSEVWVVRQVAPYVVFSVSLFLGVILYGKLKGSSEFRSLGQLNVTGVVTSSLLGCVLFVGSVFINHLIGIGLEDSAVHSTMSPARFYPYLAMTLLLTGVVQPYLEEVVFRGAMFPAARQGIGLIPAIIVVSLIFTLFHFSFLVTSFIFSVCMCVLRYRVNLFTCVVAHCAHNVCSVLVDAF